jgi:glucose/arabinose dehydrogenase
MEALLRVLPWIVAGLSLAGPALAQVEQGPPNADFAPAFAEQTRAPALTATRVAAAPFATGLENPWGIAPLPDGRWIVTERPGRMRIIGADGSLSAPLQGLPPVAAEGQGGLLDVATGPDFATDRQVWWTYAKPMAGGFVTAAARGTLSEDETTLTGVADVFVQSPVSPTPMHYGSRIVFDTAGHVFITTGEHSSDAERVLAQDIDTTFGKVIRLTADGDVPGDNPFVGRDGIDTIWSLGHRNMQGAAIDPATGRLWTVEHGPAGGDELNRPDAGANHGWPVVSYGVNYNRSPVGSGEARAPGFVEPVYYWDPVIAPGGMLFYQGTMFQGWQGDLLIASLNPGALVRLRIEDGIVRGEERMLPDLGRIRDVETMPDGSVLVLIDDSDGGIWRVTPQG